MNLKDAIEPVTRLKTSPAELIKKARETKQPIVITQNGRATAVLQDVDSYERQRETMLLMRILLQGEQAYRQGKTLTNTEANKRIDRLIEELKQNA